MHETILIVDFGGQYNELIARRVREQGVYCEVHPYTKAMDKIKELQPVGIIFTGGPSSVYKEGAPHPDPAVFEQGIPILGICYGQHVTGQMLGGHVESPDNREYGHTQTQLDTSSPLFAGLSPETVTWMSHTDYIDKLPEGFRATAKTQNCAIAAMESESKRIFCVQFHPEVEHTDKGREMIRNFLYGICNVKGDWTTKDFIETSIKEIRDKVGPDGQVLLALSGGVDSSVCAALLGKAVGSRLTCIFVDHGLMRKDEGDEIEAAFSNWDMKLIRVNAGDRFLGALKGVTDPEQKRKIIGEMFIRVFEEEGKKIGAVDYLAQGTIYPDVIESGVGDAAVIKSHHNVGGLPDFVDFKEIIEPLRLLFKDEVRKLGSELGLPDYLVSRQPFPGPGLAIRVVGEVTEDKLAVLREADWIFRDEIAKVGLDKGIHQYFAVITPMRSVGVMGDDRTYDYTLALRAITTTDFMTADWARIPYEVLEAVSGRIVNEVRGINRIVYDITSKPPATIEWE